MEHLEPVSPALSESLDRPIAFHRGFVDLTGSVTAALMLSQAIYWQRRIPEDRDGWWFKSQAEWASETGLTRREQETARKRLREAGVLIEERRGVPAKLWYRVQLERITDSLDRPIAFHRGFVDLTGSVTAALMLSQAIYWQRRIPEDRDGWWFKSQAEWASETGLTRREQETARKRLREAGVLIEERRGVPAKLWYQVEEGTIERSLIENLENNIGAPESHLQKPNLAVITEPAGITEGEAKKEAETRSLAVPGIESDPSMAESAILDCADPPFKDAAQENPSMADSANLETTKPPFKDDDLLRLAEPAMPEWRNPPVFYKETETTTETTLPPPPTPPPRDVEADSEHEVVVRPDERACPGDAVPSGGVPPSLEDSGKILQAQSNDPLPPVGELIFPNGLSGPEREHARRLINPCADSRQQILDVLATIMRGGHVRMSPLAVLGGLVKRWESGTFDPSPGIHLAVARKRQAAIQAQIALRAPPTVTTGSNSPSGRAPPGAIDEMRQALRGKRS